MGTYNLKSGYAVVSDISDLSASEAEIDLLDGVTSTTAELNILDGVTSTAAELNILDGVTSTAAELNYLDLTTLGTGAASKAVVLDAGDDYTWPAAGVLTYGVLNDGSNAITSTAAEINYLDLVTLGTGAASKAVVLDAGDDYTWPATGVLTYGVLNDGSNAITATAAEINTLDDGTGVKFVEETVGFAEFTDNADATGQFDMVGTIPIGAWLIAATVTAITGFTGDTTATMTIGDGTDVDRYNTGTIDVFSPLANGLSGGAPSGVQYHDAVETVRLMVTGGADFTSIAAGSVTVRFYYLV